MQTHVRPTRPPVKELAGYKSSSNMFAAITPCIKPRIAISDLLQQRKRNEPNCVVRHSQAETQLQGHQEASQATTGS